MGARARVAWRSALHSITPGWAQTVVAFGGSANWPRGNVLCGNQISGAPRHRRDVVSVAASARWRGVSRPSTPRCRRDLTHWLISTQVAAIRLPEQIRAGPRGAVDASVNDWFLLSCLKLQNLQGRRRREIRVCAFDKSRGVLSRPAIREARNHAKRKRLRLIRERASGL